MGKNAKLQKKLIFGCKSTPPAKSAMREKHLKHISASFLNMLGIKSRVTKGKLNHAGKFIYKPDWTKGVLEFQDNPDAAIHEFAHLYLMPEGYDLPMFQRFMDEAWGWVNVKWGFMKQKRTYFEVLPMGLEQKLRRRLGLPASNVHIKVKRGDPVRTSIETGQPIADRATIKGQTVDFIRCSRNLDPLSLERLDMIDCGELVWTKFGWTKGISIDARINARARAKAKMRPLKYKLNLNQVALAA